MFPPSGDLLTLLRASAALAAELELGPLMQRLSEEAMRLCRAQFGSFDDSFRVDEVVRRDDGRAYLAVPVRGPAGTVMGGLVVGHSEPGSFGKREEELLVALAAHAAVAIDNARRFEELRLARRLEEQRTRLAEDVGLVMSGRLPLATKLERAVAALLEHLEATFARVWLIDPVTQAFEARAHAGNHEPPTIDEEELRLVVRERRARTSSAAGSSFAGFPLVIGGDVVGVLVLLSRASLPLATFDLVGTVALELSAAIERERLDDENERARVGFLNLLGHDLRNPLSALLTGTQALALVGGLDDFSRRTLERMERSAQRMGRMVTQLIEFARARSSASLAIKRTPADLHALCRDVCDEAGRAHPTRELRLTLSGSGQGAWDCDRMTQVIAQLVGNAFTHGRVDAPVQVTLADLDRDHVVGQVHSLGAPIPAEQMTGLLDPHRRGARHHSGGAAALGLGLFLTRQYLCAHGGDLTVATHADEGTTFRFVVPRSGDGVA